MKNYCIFAKTIFLSLFSLLFFTTCSNSINKNKESDINLSKVNTFIYPDTAHKKSNNFVCIEGPLTNFIYIGFNNPLNIKQSNPNDSLSVTTSSGMLRKIDKERYEIRTNEIGKVFISVFKVNKNKKELIITKEFRVKRLPDPVPSIGSIHTCGKMKKNHLIAIGRIRAYTMNIDIDIRFTLNSFTMTSISKKGEIKESKASSDRFTNEQINQIKSLDAGDKIYFEDIIVTGPDGTVRNLTIVKITLE